MIRYDRLVPLQLQDRSLKGQYQAVQPGDCLVVFSRWKIFEVRDYIERMTNQRCAVIYGGLPSGLCSTKCASILTQSALSEVLLLHPTPHQHSPSTPHQHSSLLATRIQQANLFNDPQSECNILVATDAVGMGLNL